MELITHSSNSNPNKISHLLLTQGCGMYFLSCVSELQVRKNSTKHKKRFGGLHSKGDERGLTLRPKHWEYSPDTLSLLGSNYGSYTCDFSAVDMNPPGISTPVHTGRIAAQRKDPLVWMKHQLFSSNMTSSSQRDRFSRPLSLSLCSPLWIKVIVQPNVKVGPFYF